MAATIGSAILINPAFRFGIMMDRILHVEPMLIGFMLQFALGIALWILPRTRPRTPSPHLGTVVLLNTGVCLVAISGWMPEILLVGRLFEFAGVLPIVISILPRIRSIKPATH